MVVIQYEIIPNLSQTFPPLELFVESERLSNSVKYQNCIGQTYTGMFHNGEISVISYYDYLLYH